jgi:predicted DNA-binding transcriptional regulator AlpA
MNTLPETGFLRLTQITGDPKRGIPGILPIASSTWLEGVRLGRYPQPYRFPKNIVAWRVEDIRQMIEEAAPRPEKTTGQLPTSSKR